MFLQFIKLSPVDVMLCRCYETEFEFRKSLEAPPQSLSVCHHAHEALARWQ